MIRIKKILAFIVFSIIILKFISLSGQSTEKALVGKTLNFSTPLQISQLGQKIRQWNDLYLRSLQESYVDLSSDERHRMTLLEKGFH
jgi:hypothetical protein